VAPKSTRHQACFIDTLRAFISGIALLGHRGTKEWKWTLGKVFIVVGIGIGIGIVNSRRAKRTSKPTVVFIFLLIFVVASISRTRRCAPKGSELR
jgi:uncharacterized membrane protein SirB2